MIEYILGGSVMVIIAFVGGYSKYKSYEYRRITDEDEIEQWINDNKYKSSSYRSSYRRSKTSLSSKE